MNQADFHKDLSWSHSLEEHPIWLQIYKTAFPQMIKTISYRSDMDMQFKGVDRGVVLSTKKEILVDEKGRRRNKNGRVYDDILLEYVSNNTSGSAGWVCKPILADYIAYFITPLGICYMLPVLQLQLAWERKKVKWLEAYGTRKAKNKGYYTLNCPVSPDILFPAIGGCLRVFVKPFE